jgi:hypothetical protein
MLKGLVVGAVTRLVHRHLHYPDLHHRHGHVTSRFYRVGSVAGVSGLGGEWEVTLARATRGRSWLTEHGGGGNGFHPAIVRTCVRAFELSVIPGNRRRSSIAADSSPSWSKMARIASASVTRNIRKGWWPAARRARGCRMRAEHRRGSPSRELPFLHWSHHPHGPCRRVSAVFFCSSLRTA